MNTSNNGIVLVVDDDKLALETCRLLLETEGYLVHLATTGQEAINLGQMVRPDLFLLDILMPEIDGYETCRRLKRHDLVQDTPVIFMSALTDTIDKVKAFALGGVDFISKPIESLELLARVKTQITLSHLQQQSRQINAELEMRVASRNRDLTLANEALKAEIEERKETERALTCSQKQLRALNLKFTELEEKERQRLARELHDQVGQNLTALGLNLSVVANQLSAESKNRVRGRLKDSIAITKETAGCIRDVMAALRPHVLDDYGLKAALQMEVERFAARTGICTEFFGKDITPRPPNGVETAFFRIAQEALTNVAKHAAAQRVSVRLEHSSSLIRLLIVDNGVGFDIDQLSADHHSGWGLMTMRERIEALNGTLRIVSRPAEGARVVVEIGRCS